MKSFREQLKQEFPGTPGSFRQCVNDAVSEQRKGGRKRFRFIGMAVPAAACLILVCGTVMAAELPVFTKWLAQLGVNGRAAEEMIVHVNDGQDAACADGGQDGISVQEPLFTVTDVYFDGATFLFYVIPGAGLRELEFGDHVYINGTDNRLEYVVETEEGSGIWECEVTVMDESLAQENPGKLDVSVQVYMETGSRQEVTFTVESDKLGSIGTVADQRFELSYGIVEVCGLQTAPSKVSFTLKWIVYSQEDFEILRNTMFFAEDSSGVRYAPYDLRMNSFCSPETRSGETGWIEFEQSYEIQNFDSASEYMKFIPAVGAYEEAAPMEDMSFMIKF